MRQEPTTGNAAFTWPCTDLPYCTAIRGVFVPSVIAFTVLNNPWKHIETIINIMSNTIRKNETGKTETYVSCRPQTQRHFYYQAMTTQALLVTQVPVRPINISIFVPSLWSPQISIAIDNLPQSKPSNWSHNESLTLLIQHKLKLPIIDQTKQFIWGTTFNKYGDHAFGCHHTSKTTLLDAIMKTLTITIGPLHWQ